MFQTIMNIISRNRLSFALMKTILKFLILLIFCLLLIFCAGNLFMMVMSYYITMFVNTQAFHPPSSHQSLFEKRTTSEHDLLGESKQNYGRKNYNNYSIKILPSLLKGKAKQRIKFFRNIFSEKKRKLWMRISDQVFVYSAHLDTRNFSSGPPMKNNLTLHEKHVDDSDKSNRVILVRIVGMKAVPPLREFIKNGNVLDWFRIKHEMEFSQKYECKLFFSPKKYSGKASSPTLPLENERMDFIKSTKLTYTVIEEGVKIYAGCYFNCYFTVPQNSTILSVMDSFQVALYPKDVSDYPTKLIDVSGMMIKAEKNLKLNSLGICVRPLFGPFDDFAKLIQFISYYHAMGIEIFNFYLLSISQQNRKFLEKLSEMSQMLENAKNEGKVLPRFILNDWNLPTGNTSELWDYGTLAALNDCLLSNVDREFLLFVDIDEFIVPQKKLVHHKMPLLWSIINSYNRSSTYQFLIRNTFFCHEFCHNSKGNLTSKVLSSASSKEVAENTPISYNSWIDWTRLPIFSCTTRTKKVWNVAIRSKYFVNPRQVLAVGHHRVNKFVDKVDSRFTSGYSVQVAPEVGLMNHYRECKSISSNKNLILTRVKERDETILRFEREVKNNILEYLSTFTSGMGDEYED